VQHGVSIDVRARRLLHLSPLAGRGRIVEASASTIRVRGAIGMRGANFVKTARARRLRRQSTDAELKLWNHVRSRAIEGCKFVRQEPIGPYIVDFVCRERRLVIEVDGGQHATDPRDAVRDRWLTEHRYRVLRFWNNDVLSNIEGVLETIASALASDSPPHPDSARSAR
jgi:very-short-patch-repair endonuclease